MNRLTSEQLIQISKLRSVSKSLDTISRDLQIDRNTVAYHIRRIDRGLWVAPHLRKSHYQKLLANARAARSKNLDEQVNKKLSMASGLWKTYHLKMGLLSTSVKGRIAETATLLRLLLRGVEVYTPACEDGPRDLLVISKGASFRIQVKLARRSNKLGFPVITAGKNNKKLYCVEDCDFIIAYDLFLDSCYVLPIKNVVRPVMRLKDEFLENWSFLK